MPYVGLQKGWKERAKKKKKKKKRKVIISPRTLSIISPTLGSGYNLGKKIIKKVKLSKLKKYKKKGVR